LVAHAGLWIASQNPQHIRRVHSQNPPKAMIEAHPALVPTDDRRMPLPDESEMEDAGADEVAFATAGVDGGEGGGRGGSGRGLGCEGGEVKEVDVA
jgi:hypothetical protein